MKTISMVIDDKAVEAKEWMTILEVARENGIHIPTLCYDERLEPYGACRLCMVEILNGKKPKLVASCVYPVQEGLVVRTDSERIRRNRRMIVELLWPSVPGLAEELGVKESRFASDNTECSLCGLCVRYCAEVKKLNVAYFKGRGIDCELAVIPELADECVYCRECFDLCRGGLIVNQCDNAYGPERAS